MSGKFLQRFVLLVGLASFAFAAPARAAVIEVVFGPFNWVSDPTAPVIVVEDDFGVENSLYIRANAPATVDSIWARVAFSFEGDNGGDPVFLAEDAWFELAPIAVGDQSGYLTFAVLTDLFLVAQDPSKMVIEGGLFTADIIRADVCFPNPGCVMAVPFRGITSANFRAVPEPTTLAIFGLGLAGLGFFMTRRRRVV